MSDEQLTRDQLDGMSAEEIIEAGAAGRLDNIFQHRRRQAAQLTREHVRGMEPADIRDALKDGRLDNVLRGETA
jgi:hypothetical protein